MVPFRVFVRCFYGGGFGSAFSGKFHQESIYLSIYLLFFPQCLRNKTALVLIKLIK